MIFRYVQDFFFFWDILYSEHIIKMLPDSRQEAPSKHVKDPKILLKQIMAEG